jgi:PAS domain S-box-containing protein
MCVQRENALREQGGWHSSVRTPRKGFFLCSHPYDSVRSRIPGNCLKSRRHPAVTFPASHLAGGEFSTEAGEFRSLEAFVPPPSDQPSISADLLFQNAFNHAAIGMALVAPDGHWLRVNSSLCELIGYTEDDLLKIRFQDVTHPDDLDLDLENVGKLLRGEILNYQMEKRYLRKDGTIAWVLLSVSLVSDKKGHPHFFISQIQDISARKEGEQKLLQATAEIKRLRTGLLKVCSWTKRIEIDGRWIPIEEFLSQYLHLRLTPGMSEEAVKLFGQQAPPVCVQRFTKD